MKQKLRRLEDTEQTIDPHRAIGEMKSGKNIIYYRTKERVAVLIRIDKRKDISTDEKSVRPNKNLWGFAYLDAPAQRGMTFIRSSAEDCVRMAQGHGNDIYLANNIKSIFTE